MNTRDELLNKANSLIKEKKFVEAINILEKNIDANSGDNNILFFLGYSYQKIEQFENAIHYFRRCLETDPANPDILNEIGVSLMGMRLFDKAITVLQAAIEISPNNIKLYNNLGAVFNLTGQFNAAIECLTKAIKLDAFYTDAYQNISHSYSFLGDFEKAEFYNKKALAIAPDSVDANFDYSIIKFNKGEFIEGWKFYEWRIKKNLIGFQDFSKPGLENQDVAGKTILLYDEQGFGDTIQFARFIPMLKQKGCSVVLVTHEKLVDLMQNSKIADKVIPKKVGSFSVDYDFHIPLLSLPNYLKISEEKIPVKIPYLFVDEELKVKKRKAITGGNQLKVGIVWRGKLPLGSEHRTTSLKFFLALQSIPGVQLYSLQADTLTGEENEILLRSNIIDLSGEVYNFYNTAAVMMNLDLIITIDTYSAHLAGALGKEVWTLLSYKGDWRWLSRQGKSIWYPNISLIKQYKFGEWEPVFEQVYNRLLFHVNDYNTSL